MTFGYIFGFTFGGGSDFYLQTASQAGTQKIQVVFNQAPDATDPTGVTDALNPSNYVLSGPQANIVSSVIKIDSVTFELNLQYPLAVGYWTTTVVNVSSGVYVIGNPTSWTFLVSSAFLAPNVNGGAKNKDAYDLLRKFLNPALKGTNWDALLRALSIGEAWNAENAQLAYNQMYICTAAANYLIQRANDQGVSYPYNVGMSDEVFRQYAISVKNRKVTENAFLRVLDIFYGTDSVRGHVVSKAQPYDLIDGDELNILIDEATEVKVIFHDNDFAIPSQAKAIEVAAAINRAFAVTRNPSYAVTETSPLNGDVKVKIYSGGLGVGSTVRITGGSAQNELRFPTFLDIYTADPLPDWNVTYIPETLRTRFTIATGDLNPDLTGLRIGDYVNIYGSEFLADNRGSFAVVDLSISYTLTDPGVLVAWFEIEHEGADQTVTQLTENSIEFYRPTLGRTYASIHQSASVVDLGDWVEVTLPATSVAVKRTKYRAAYLQDPVYLDGIELSGQNGIVTITTSEAHGLSIGDQVIVENFQASLVTPQIQANGPAESDSSNASIWDEIPTTLFSNYGGIASTLYDNTVVWGFGSQDTLEKCVLTITQSNGQRVVGFQTSVCADTVLQSYRMGYASIPEVLASPYGLGPSLLVSGGIEYLASGPLFPTQDSYYYRSDLEDLVAAGSMVSPRAFHTVTQGLQSDGTSYQMMAVGGMTAPGQATETCEAWVGGSWGLTGSMGQARCDHAAVVIGDSLTLVSGGRQLAVGPIVDGNTVALWRMSDGPALFDDLGPNSIDLTGIGTAFLTTNDPVSYQAIHFTSGNQIIALSPTADPIFNLLDGSFTIEMWVHFDADGTVFGIQESNYLRFGINTSIVIGDLLVYFYDSTNTYHQIQTGFDVGTLNNYWNHLAVSVARTSPTTGLYTFYINGQEIAAVSGAATAFTSLPDSVTFGIGYTTLPAPVTWDTFEGSFNQIRISDTDLTAAQIWDSYIGSVGETFWQETDDDLGTERCGLPLNTCEIFYSDVQIWDTTGPMAIARFGHAMVELPNGEVMVLGGLGQNPTQPNRPNGSPPYNAVPLYSCEVWNSTTNRWRSVGNLSFNSGILTAKYMPEMGGVLICNGGSDQTEFYDCRTGKFRVLGPTHQSTVQSPAAVSQNVLVTFGGTQDTFDGVEVVDPVQMWIPNATYYYGGSMQQPFTVTSVPSGTTFTVENPLISYIYGDTAFQILKLGQDPTPAGANFIPGPFILDPNAGLAITGTKSTTTQALTMGHRYNSVTIADGTDFPDSGYVVFAFGTKDQVGPVPYISKISNTELSLDHRFTFAKSVPIGSDVVVLFQKDPYNPKNSLDLGVFWLTDAPSGRLTCQNTIQSIQSATSSVLIDVVYPGARGVGAESFPDTGYKVNDIVPAFGGQVPRVVQVGGDEDGK